MVIMKKEPLFGILLEREMYDKYNIFKFHDIIKVYKTKDDRFIDDSGNKFYSYEDSAVINKQEKFFIGETINLDIVESQYNNDVKIFKEKAKEYFKNIIYFGIYNDTEKNMDIAYIDLDEMYKTKKKNSDILDSRKLYVGISLADLEILIKKCEEKKYFDISHILKNIRDDYHDKLFEELSPYQKVFRNYDLPQ